MNKEFIPYEQALELKELGFDEECIDRYDPRFGKLSSNMETWSNKYYPESLMIPAPLYQQAFRWFREKYDIQYWLHDGGYLGKVFIKITGYKHDKFYFSSSEPMEYEEAEFACIIKLIDIVKNK